MKFIQYIQHLCIIKNIFQTFKTTEAFGEEEGNKKNGKFALNL